MDAPLNLVVIKQQRIIKLVKLIFLSRHIRLISQKRRRNVLEASAHSFNFRSCVEDVLSLLHHIVSPKLQVFYNLNTQTRRVH